MEGKALIWCQDLKMSRGITSLEIFVEGLQTWFGLLAYEDPTEAHTKLK